MEDNKPRARKKRVTENSKGIKRRGEGLNSGQRRNDDRDVQQLRERRGDNDSNDDALDRLGHGETTRGAAGSLLGVVGEIASSKEGREMIGNLVEMGVNAVSKNEKDPYGVSAREDDFPSGSADSYDQHHSSYSSGGNSGNGRPPQGPYSTQQPPRKRNSGCAKYIILIVLLIVAYFVVRSLFGGLVSGNGNNGGSNGSSQDVYEQNYAQTIASGNGVQNGWAIEEAEPAAVTEETASQEEQTAEEQQPQETQNEQNDQTQTSTPVAREKFTKIIGNGQDVVTIMVYMCGTDLESKNGMATADLQEMLNSKVGGNVNLIIYTGGCARWRNNVMSSRYNEIYQIKDGQLMRLIDNAGTGAMTDPATLLSFLQWGQQNFPANRYDLIMWDHGTGSLYGYGYDEKNPRSGQMTLEQIDRALTQSGIKFDFVGFDACLMANVETAIMLGDNADYMIASEETEPGVGWYYTEWLSALNNNTSMPTEQIGRNIVDSFVLACSKQTPGQATTLSVVDLAELSQTLPDKMKAFSVSTTQMIDAGYFKNVSNARSSSKEFAKGQNLDQIDLMHFASLVNTAEGRDLIETVKSAVKYNRTSKNVVNAYGLSVYFPYRSTKYVDIARAIYNAIGVDSSYSDLITRFGQYQVSGQSTQGGSQSPYYQLFGSQSGSSQSDYSDYGSISTEDAMQLLELLLGGRMADIEKLGIEGLTADNTKFLSEGDLNIESIAKEVTANRLTQDDMKWVPYNGGVCLDIAKEKWSTVSGVKMGTFVDDGIGFIDLGLDNIYTFDKNKLIPETDGTWIAIDGQPMAYYHTETIENGDYYSMRGYVPVLLNGDRANLIIVFDSDNEYGYVAGATYDYTDTEAVAKNLEGLVEGDEIEFIATCYNYDGSVDDEYIISDVMTIEDPAALEIANADVTESGKVKVVYCITDEFGSTYWTEPIEIN